MIRCGWMWRPIASMPHRHIRRHIVRYAARHVRHHPSWRLVWTCIVASGAAGGAIGYGATAALMPSVVSADFWAGPDRNGGEVARVPEPSTLQILGAAVVAAFAIAPGRR